MDGLLLIDKPTGPTSFAVVRAVRRLAKIRKVGHTGTLDPLASGLLVCCLGQGTKLVPFLLGGEKRYLARVMLGVETDTGDAGGRPIDKAPVPDLDRRRLLAVLESFVGRITQTPPRFSALKKDGEPLYRKARRGDDFSVQAREVEINGLVLLELTESGFTLDIRCGKGTYIRSLARDLSRALDTRGHLAELRRIENSGFQVGDAVAFGDIETPPSAFRLLDRLIPLEAALPRMPKLRLDAAGAARILHGQALPYEEISVPRENSEGPARDGHVALLDENGSLLAVARLSDGGLQPVRLLR